MKEKFYFVNVCKAFCLLSLLIGSSLFKSQTKGSSEIKISYGLGTSTDFINTFNTIFTLGYGPYEKKNSGAFIIEYNYAVKDRWVVGADLVYQQMTREYLDESSEKSHNYTVAVKSDYNYISKPKFRMYSGLGLGLTMEKSSNPSQNMSHFNFQLTGLGIRLGGRLGVNAELGFGYKGIVNAGLAYTL
nr:outer membrane beta-barrel protein [uncultured Chryseobacterium sp.]